MNCPNCAVSLVCTVDTSCWCMDYPPIVKDANADGCLCAACLQTAIAAQVDTVEVHDCAPESALRCQNLPLVEGLDYMVENGLWVFSRWSHLKRGSCCGNSCRNCPYGYVNVAFGVV